MRKNLLLALFLAVAANTAAFAQPWPLRPGDFPLVADAPDFPPLVPSPNPGRLTAPHERSSLSPDAQSVATANNRFALDIYRELSAAAKPGDNLLVSPFSISTALAMTYAGARGNTAAEMADTLHFSLPQDRLHAAYGELVRELDVDRAGYDLGIANRLFGMRDYPFKQQFLTVTDQHYGAPLEQLDFYADPEGSRQHINQWVEDQTNNKIKDLLPSGSINGDTRLVLTNAVYFNGDWKYKFDKNFTQEKTFYRSPGSESLVPMMHQQEFLPYAERPDFQLLELPYAGDDLSMVLLLPREYDGLAALEASLTNEGLDAALADLRREQVQLRLPKFTFDASFSLSNTLQSMGISDAFNGFAADFTGMTDAEPLHISSVLHKAFIDVNEEGTEAAAATAVIMTTTTAIIGPPPPPKVFRADHPFLFALRDRHSGSLLFMGRVNDPGSGPANALFDRVPEPQAMGLVIFAAIGLSAAYRGHRGRLSEAR